MIYLDYAAHTRADEQVLKCFYETEMEYIANPNSLHPLGVLAKEELDKSSVHLANLLRIKPNEIIYTSGASEANNLAIKGIVGSYRENGKHIISTFIEHPSVSATLTSLQQQGYEIDLLNLLPNGQIDLEQLQELIRKDTVLVSVCYVDSEVGTIQPIKEISEILKSYENSFFHTDATQAVGKIDVDFSLADCTVFAPHKFFGLNSSGVLVKKEHLVLTPQISGGTSASIYRSGTPSLSHIKALDAATTTAIDSLNENYEKVLKLNSFLQEELKKLSYIDINSQIGSSPYIINMGIKGVKAKDFTKALYDRGFCVSIKSACSVLTTPSRTVMAIYNDKKRARSSFRVSISQYTTEQELEMLVKAIEDIYSDLN